MTYLSNLMTYIVIIGCFLLVENTQNQFSIISVVISVFGGSCSLMYFININEKSLNTIAIKSAGMNMNSISSDATEKLDGAMAWISNRTFYMCGIIYGLTRLSICSNLMLTPFYMINVMGFKESTSYPTPVVI